MKMFIIFFYALLLMPLEVMAIHCDDHYLEVFNLKQLENAFNKIDKNTLTAKERNYLTTALNPHTRSNIGGSLNSLSESEYLAFYKKINSGEKFTAAEKLMLQSVDQAQVYKVYTELLQAPKIHPNIRGRSSPRAFDTTKSIADKDVKKIFEAAKWSASAFNEQPWRYIYATKDDIENYNKLKELLDPWNQAWAQDAPVIAIALKKKTFTYNGKVNPFATHDVGMAQSNLAFEAQSMGISVHPMGGFFPEKAKELLKYSDDFEPVTMMAMGYKGNVKALPETLQETELVIRDRKALETFVFEGNLENKKSFSELPLTEWRLKDYKQTHLKPENGENPVHEIIANRTSKRAFSDKSVSDEDIGSLFEAARWAPSAFNEQPWMFVYVKKSDLENYNKFLPIINDFNTPWAKEADVLILGLAKKTFAKNGKPNSFAIHDLGMAQGNMQLQAEALGLNARQMGGIEPLKAKEILGFSDDFEAVSAIAVGYKGEVTTLPEMYQLEETATRNRKSLEELIIPIP